MSDAVECIKCGAVSYNDPGKTRLYCATCYNAFEILMSPMPCGHLARYSYPPSGDEGTTRICLVCELTAIRKAYKDDEWSADNNETIDDGFGNVWPRNCHKCGAEMQIVRPGDCRCSVCDEKP